MSFIVATDTSSNIPTPEAAAKGIIVIPLSYNFQGHSLECLDTESFRYDQYYESLRNGTAVTTSQINPQKYIDRLEPVLKEGQDVLFVGMSSGISGSFNSAVIAAEQLLEAYPDRKIRLVDSLGASLGEGLLTLKAWECMDSGMSLDETADLLTELREHIYQVFTVDDLMYLKRGGRLSNAAALLGTLLNIKPVLKGNEIGKIVAFQKVRGRKGVLNDLAKRYDNLVTDAENQVVGISHCNCREDADYLAGLLQKNHPPKEILIVEHEPVTGSYLGPGALALYFAGGKDIRTK